MNGRSNKNAGRAPIGSCIEKENTLPSNESGGYMNRKG